MPRMTGRPNAGTVDFAAFRAKVLAVSQHATAAADAIEQIESLKQSAF
jgi:hypothetical protein